MTVECRAPPRRCCGRRRQMSAWSALTMPASAFRNAPMIGSQRRYSGPALQVRRREREDVHSTAPERGGRDHAAEGADSAAMPRRTAMRELCEHSCAIVSACSSLRGPLPARVAMAASLLSLAHCDRHDAGGPAAVLHAFAVVGIALGLFSIHLSVLTRAAERTRGRSRRASTASRRGSSGGWSSCRTCSGS